MDSSCLLYTSLIPWAMPAVVIGMAAKWGFNNDYGLVNDFIRRFVPNFQYDWMIHTGSARAAVIALSLIHIYTR